MNCSDINHLLPCLSRLAQLQHENIDILALQEAVETAMLSSKAVGAPQFQIKTVTQRLQLASPRWLDRPDAAQMPALIFAQDSDQGRGQWGVLRGQNSQGQWISDWWDADNHLWIERAVSQLDRHSVAILRLTRPYSASKSPMYQLIRQELFSHGSLIRDALVGGMMISVLALVTSFYSMQIYDRVIPTAAVQTLLVLTLGVLVAIVFEWLAKRVRSRLYDRMIEAVDQRLTRSVFLRFLSVRLDQLPQSVGALSAQMRGYETVRGFFTSATSSLLVDAPFALLFLGVIAMIGGWLALIPLVFFAVCLLVGIYYRKKIESLANNANNANNKKTGLLVEAIEGAETIKSGQGGWRILSHWMKNADDARDSDLHIRNVSEQTQHLASMLQQFSYILLVAAGAMQVSRGELTLGSLIACSILSSRVLSPVSTIPGQLVQWAHAKAALQGLDRLWALQDDHHGQEAPIVLAQIRGAYRVEGVIANYGGKKALSLPNLVIRPGEKIGVLGPIGAGKTTLLRILSGMYKPQEGRILLDDVDIAHLSKPLLAEHLGYVQQDGRLFAGSLRDNLILGLLDPGDEAILQVARDTGLLHTVIANHPKGLQQEIFEGGTGLSGGQRQLVNLTRAFLRQPRIWLLDEPTASMDRNLEKQVTQALKDAIGLADTLVLVTHKAEMFDLVERLIVVANHQVVIDGPKKQVLQKLQTSLMPNAGPQHNPKSS